MEQMLWDAACSIPGKKDAAKFEDYLLPLLFLERPSDVFDDEVDRLAEEFGNRAVAQASPRCRSSRVFQHPSNMLYSG